ncbi:amino acid adenylation domain-containing protein [Streptomyces coffeae]|uniref:Amino acid adenylation domain-containing protein n=1 Tax=Streptomyces coffeae TaxID=621382 RepID=A0ABS1NQ66_9ACTN|nr:non-ribosomal peptide synthetase [Streptomyces coffeae]MBL1102148.1 amino acid adenylation domain-containing protein [Streptomyces coffeae]
MTRTAAVGAAFRVTQGNEHRRSPLTAYQRDIWAASSQAPESPQFNCVLHERLRGGVDHGALAECVENALYRHDTFRLRFGEHAGAPFQWVAGEVIRVSTVDLTQEPEPDVACADWMRRSMATALPLADGGALVEATLLLESPDVTHLHIKAHHIVADGWTVNELSHEILEDYARATGAGQEPTGRRAPSSYLAFVEEEAAYRAGAEGDRAFHREALAGVAPALFTRTAGGSGRGRHSFIVEGRLADRVRAAGLSPFAYIAAMFGTWLTRLHRSEEVVLGVPFLNRPEDHHKDVLGQFANTLPLRVAAPGGRTVRELVAETQDATYALRRHERLALGDVQRELPLPAEGPRQLFDVTVSYLHWSRPAPIPGVERQTAMMAPSHEQDALGVMVCAFDDTADIRIDLDYALDVFDEDLPIASVAGHLGTLLAHAVDELDRPASAVAMLTPVEHRDLTAVRSHGPQVPYADEATLHGLFEEQAARRPRQTAAIGATGETLTYAELDERANRVARALRDEGVGPDDRVAVMMERGPRQLVALLGTLKSGGAYVPVDRDYPSERVWFLLEDSRAKVVIVDGDAPATGVPEGAAVRHVEDLLHGSGAPLPPLAGSRDLAYVIYTSGSTGRPKGVMVEHHSVVNRLAWMQRSYPLGDGDVLLYKTPVSFDVSVWELFWWAVEGASVALLPPGGQHDPREILRTIAEQRVSVVHFVPSMLGPFLDLLQALPEAREGLRSLRYVFCSGEALPPERVEQFNRVFGISGAPCPVRLVNLYGPTEATVDVSYYDCPGDPARSVARVPIGRPIDNTRLYVLGPGDLPQPVGVAGELCIGGAGVARGYLDRPELTAEKFVADPFVPDGRLYRTGDLARWLADGTLEYLGRIDGQVKIRGNRVEPGEVAGALRAVPGVRDAIVVDHTDAARGIHLAGYYVADAAIDPVRLRELLARTLPAFMVPARFLRIDAIPLTPNGKADRRALPPLSDTADTATGPQPRNPTEAALAEIWARVLDRETVGVHDDYFTLGGDSILMLKVRAEAEAQGLRFSLTDLMHHPTVAGLATCVQSRPAPLGEGAPAPFALVSGVDRARLEGAEDAWPLTRLQLGLLYHSRRHETSATYKDVFQYTLELPWDEDAFRRSFDRLVARHPVLRSAFDLAGFSEPLQIVGAPEPGGLDIVDLRSLDSAAADAEVRAHIDERRRHAYAFDRAPLYLFRAHLRPEAVDLVLSFHHALLDGGSVANLLQELLQDYAHGLGLGIGPVDGTAPPSAACHVQAELAALGSAEARRYWKEKLAGCEPPQTETFRAHLPGTGREPSAHRADLPDALVAQVRRFAAQHDLPLKSVLFAAHCLTLATFAGAGTREVTTGLITHGRPELACAERTAGLFLNTVPLRLDVAQAAWLDVAREALRQEQDSHPHRRYPLSAIQEDHGGPVLDTAFNYVHFHQLSDVLRLPDVRLRDFRTWEETSFRLLVNAVTEPDGAGVWLRIDCDGDGFCADQARVFADGYRKILRRMVEDPHGEPEVAFLADRPVLARATSQPTVVERVTRQAARIPDGTALVMGEERWSYARLARTADRVARRLCALGAPPQARIGIAMDRSPQTIAVILGVLRAGCAVVPLDTGYPAQRLATMLEQALPFRVIAHAPYAHLVGDPSLLLSAASVTESAPGPVVEPPAEIPAESTAYVLFTSGSTGRPKGVTMPHRSLAGLVAWQIHATSGAVGGATLQYAPLSFDVSFQEIFSTLCSGGTLHLVGDAERRDMPELLRLIDRAGIERVFLPYVALQQLAETAQALGIVPRALRVLISSGEQLRVTQEIRRLCAALPDVVLENQYGPTETHVATAFTMTGDPAAFPPLPPIGRPVDGAEAYVLDDRLRPVPAGARGTIHLGGSCLADGYEGRPDLTKERFIPHPFAGEERMLYDTGDLGLVLPDGTIAYAGRADTQVKVRGFRVELAEVELALTDLAGLFPGLRDAAVVARRHENGDCLLTAFLMGEGTSSDLTGIRELLRTALPDHMVPSHLQWVTHLPKTPSGKRDDAALRRVPLTPTAEATGAGPRDAYERALSEMLADLLRLPAVGVSDSLFDLGGTSLTAMRLVVRIEQRYGVNVPLSEFIAAPTVAGLAALLRAGGAVPAFDPLVPIRPEGTRPPLFMVHPMGGNVLCYVRFARHLPDDQPLYALQAAGADPGTRPLRTVEELADSYLAALRKVQPHGPYVLGGWSFGGFVAFEIARRLRASGEDVARLVLLDTTALSQGQRHRHDDDALLGWFFWELLWLERGGDSPMEDIPGELISLDEKFDFIARLATDAGVLPAGSSGAVIRRLFRVYQANWKAALDYRPEAGDQGLTLIRAAEPLPDVLAAMHGAAGSRHEEPTNGWGDMTDGPVGVIGVPGDHLTIMEEPYVEHVARTVAELIRSRRSGAHEES